MVVLWMISEISLSNSNTKKAPAEAGAKRDLFS